MKDDRYYFHGDIASGSDTNRNAVAAVKANPGELIAFCAICDAFDTEEHILNHEPELRYDGSKRKLLGPRERYEHDVRRYPKASAEWRRRNVRPENAPNIFTK